jgi:spermidine synthase
MVDSAREPPPGYRLAGADHESAQIWRAPFHFSLLTALVLSSSWHEVCVRQALAYGSVDQGLGRWIGTLAGLAGVVLGALGVRKTRAYTRAALWLVPLFMASGVAVAASASLLFAGFGSSSAPWLGTLVPLVTGLWLGATASVSWSALQTTWRQLSLLAELLDPFRLVIWVLVAIVTVTLLPLIGFLRSAYLMSGLFALLALWHLRLHAFLERAPLPHTRRWTLLVLSWGFFQGTLFAGSERWVSREQTRYFHGAILYTYQSERSELAVTTGPLGVQLFVNRSLRAADVDRHRYFEALVHPAFATTRRAARVLVLGTGDGLVESEVLLYPEVQTLDVVVEDRRIAGYAAHAAWLSQRTRAAMSSARVRVAEAEAIVWLGASHTPYDVIIVDLPDPSQPRWGKNYTSYFFERVRAHLTATGVVSVQSGSSQASPKLFANVAATLGAAGLHPLPYHAAVPSIGDWGFVLGSRKPLDRPNRLRMQTRFLTDAVLRASFFIPRDSRAEPGAPSTLDDQRVIGLLLQRNRVDR